MALIFSCCLYGQDTRYSDSLFKNDLCFVRDVLSQECDFIVYCNTDVKPDLIERLVAHGYVIKIIDFKKTGMGAMFIRYLPILDGVSDPDDVVFVRDTDCCYSNQELKLIKRWLESDKDFHIIRGHPLHIYPIMGGLFGIRGGLKMVFDDVFRRNKEMTTSWSYNADQIFLAKKIYPKVAHSALVHTVRVVFSGELYEHYKNDEHFIGETMLFDEKRNRERCIAQRYSDVVILNSFFSKLMHIRVFAKLISIWVLR